MGWQTRSSRTVYQNRWIRVREDEVVGPDGTDGIYGVLEVRSPAVFVVAITPVDEVVLVEIDRYTLDQPSLEVPGGTTDGQEPLVAGRRELLEETGLTASSWRDLGQVCSLNGVSQAPGRVVLARDARPDRAAAGFAGRAGRRGDQSRPVRSAGRASGADRGRRDYRQRNSGCSVDRPCRSRPGPLSRRSTCGWPAVAWLGLRRLGWPERQREESDRSTGHQSDRTCPGLAGRCKSPAGRWSRCQAESVNSWWR